MPPSTPLAIFAYRRPEHLRRLLGSVGACARLEECGITIFCDGPRRAEDAGAVEAVRVIAREWAAVYGAKVVERSENKGLAHSIVDEVTSLCAEAGRAIVLEDDLEVSPDFLRYMLSALDRYESDANVVQISGYMFPVEHPGTRDTFFLPLATTWGWATWARAWQRFSWDASEARHQLADAKTRHRFDLDDSYGFAEMLEARARGENDSWGILWQWAVFASGGAVVHPRTTHVKNHGFDGSGTHCGKWPAESGLAFAAFPENIRWPGEPVDRASFQRLKKYLRKRQPTTPRRWLRNMSSILLERATASCAGRPRVEEEQ